MSSWADRPGRSRRQVPLAPDGARSPAPPGLPTHAPNLTNPRATQHGVSDHPRVNVRGMNYPLWDLPAAGLLIAFVAIVHVFVAHFAVGGGLFLVWTERKARRENDAALLDYVRRHSRFFILLTLVFGAV